MLLTSTQKKYLRGLAHKLKPVIQIGKSGFTKELQMEMNIQLEIHELIKIRFMDFKEEKKEIMAQIEARLLASSAGIIGHIGILYRQAEDLKKRKIKIPKKTEKN